jgi:lipopolysaccharide export system ATP-binding protein
MIHTLEADSILLEFGLKRILSDIYLKCETGTITGLLGRNGQGKTCLLNIIYGSMEPVSKSIRFDGKSVFNAFKQPHLLSYLPQFNFIPRSLTLKRVFSDFQLDYAGFETHFPEFRDRRQSTIKDLSGGQRRLVETYTIIKSKSRFALLDEPFTHLMPLQIEKIKELLLAEKSRKGFIMTDHLYRDVTDIADRLYILSDGKTHLATGINDIEKFGYARLDTP